MTIIADGFVFLEAPRWRDGRLYFSDMDAGFVFSWHPVDGVQKIVEVVHRPSGLGWDADGRMLIVSMEDRQLLRLDEGNLTTVADLSGIATFHCNDMVVDARGGAYIGNFGSNLEGVGAKGPVPAKLVYVAPDGDVRVVAENLAFPNGAVITRDGRTLIIGESFAAQLTAFDRKEDGRLSNRRVWASVPGRAPDGCCLDAQGAIWMASPVSNDFIRILEGGEITEVIEVEQKAIACVLGGDDGRTLFLLTSKHLARRQNLKLRSARIETRRVIVPSGHSP